MKYFSTRTGFEVSAAEAIARGLAPNGGLFVPDQLPVLTEEKLAELLQLGSVGRFYPLQDLPASVKVFC